MALAYTKAGGLSDWSYRQNCIALSGHGFVVAGARWRVSA